MISENFNEKLNKIEALTKTWNLRQLTLKGKILICNTMLISQLIYVGTVLHTPKWVIIRYNQLIRDFIWNNKPAKVKHLCLINSIENGGLKLQNLETKLESIKFKWIQKLANSTINKPWKAYICELMKVPIQEFMTYNIHGKDLKHIPDIFYKEIIETWVKLNYNEPEKVEDILRQVIWNNSLLKIDGKAINYKSWIDKGIIFIRDLLDNTGKWASKNFLEAKFNTTINFLEYLSLTHTIPKEWKKKINTDKFNKDIIIYNHPTLKINGSYKKLEEINTKAIYWKLTNEVAQRPTSENTWKEKTELDLTEDEWAIIYKMTYKLTTNTKLIAFNFKITHRILAIGEKLKTWKIKDSDLCDECNSIETIEHFLVECPSSLIFWKHIFNWWGSMSQVKFPLLTYEIIFGIPNESEEVIIENFNYILLCATYYVYKSKLKKEQLDTYKFLLECKNRLIYDIAILEEKNKKHGSQKWNELKNMFNIDYDEAPINHQSPIIELTY
jgi:hypothetical protein